ncbi:MAG: protein tyrosine phosphatase [Isosphaeraceae bacterium]|nr:protein tyrosine phosphatase [Isosphaeraceae bacterium]
MRAEPPDDTPASERRRFLRFWPWLVLALAVVPAVWHVVDFPNDTDPEFPQVERPTFSRRPPPAYRLAEPGDTIDRIAIYVSAIAVVFSIGSLARAPGNRRLWLAALILSLAAFWHGATPGPTFDGWHGLGWRAMFDTAAPRALRLELASASLVGLALIAGILFKERARWRDLWGEARSRRVALLLVVAAVLVALRQVEVPGVEPVGYWPRWAFVWGMIAFDLALVQLLPPLPARRRPLRAAAWTAATAGFWFALTVGGIWVTLYHRPIDRFRAIVPGRIFISAMPTEWGLDVIQRRHHIKTIINLFPEDTPFQSARHPAELRFAQTHGIRYVGSPADLASSNAFLDRTLELAQDPNAWPILVHCHGCMDRTPAWWGIYRFVVQGDPLNDILRDIERHRGYRPKSSVTLLYNRVLPRCAPEHYRQDPTAARLVAWAHGAHDPDEALIEAGTGVANPGTAPRVGSGEGRDGRVPNLTQMRRSLQYKQALRDRPHPEPATPR